jgi:RNA ligase-like protein
MKIETPENKNYVATVVRIKNTYKLDGLDNLVGVKFFGFQALMSKNTEVDTLGVIFTAETQLSEEYTRKNNLYRHQELNEDSEVGGYIEDNRRVKAIRLKGHASNALFMPIKSLSFTGVNVEELNEGDAFDKLNGYEICKKFTRKQKVSRIEKNKAVVFKRVDEKFMPEHYDSENYFKNAHVIKGTKQVIITQKLHGTSIRIGNTIVKRKLTKRDKVAELFGVEVSLIEFAHVYGSRKVIKDINNPNQNHFYGEDLWTEVGKKYDGSIPENFIVYGELIGWAAENAPIQKGYTYRVPNGECELYIYRVAVVTNQGMLVDLSWEQVKEFCRDRGLKHVPELWVGMHKYFKVEDWLDKNYFAEGYKQAVPLDDNSPCDEGVCVRVDGIAPYILKAKSPMFFEHETKMIDEGAVDTEEDAKEEAIDDEPTQ